MSILAIGEVVIDWLSENPGESLYTASTFQRSLGGNATNFAIGVSRLGHKVKLIGKIGNDFHGQYLSNILKAENIDTNYLFIDNNYPTAQCYITIDKSGEPAYHNWPKPHAADRLAVSDIEDHLFSNIDIMHATGISLMRDPRKAAIEKAIDLCLAKNIVVSFDACFPTHAEELAKQSVENILYKAHILKFNYHELLFWSQGSKTDSIAQLTSSLFAKYKPIAIIITLSSEGSYVMNSQNAIMCKPYSIESNYPVGAGDAFMAGLMHGLKNTLPEISTNSLMQLDIKYWQKACLTGNITGALVTRDKSAYTSFPSLNELTHLIN